MHNLASTHRLRATYGSSECQDRILAFLTVSDQPVELKEIRDIRCMPLATVEEVLAATETLERDGKITCRQEWRKTRDGRQRMITVYALVRGGES